MLVCYQILVGLLFWVSFPFLLVFVLITGKHRHGLSERLGLYKPAPRASGTSRRIWIHAASIGEVRAAGVLIDHLKPQAASWDFLVTTMTIHGRDFARQHLGSDINCYLAPLDVPFIAGRVVDNIDPDLYVCLETELWPLLISHLDRTRVAALLLNGRLSEQSISGYLRFKFFFGPIVQKFNAIGAITEEDRERFIAVGANPENVTVTGNIKHDFNPPVDRSGVIRKWAETLGIDPGTDVVVCGSTHDPEEELLLPVYKEMTATDRQVWLIAPRHLDRLAAIFSILDLADVNYDLLSSLKQGNARTGTLIIVDTFGDLTELFSIATFVFIGGSLTSYGGHNVMEAAMWEKIVFFGPHMSDFKDAATILEKCGGGYRVDTVEAMKTRMESFLQDRKRLSDMQLRAGEAAAGQQGAGIKQAELILELIDL